MTDAQQQALDALALTEIEDYIKSRRKREYDVLGAVDGWERLAADLEWETPEERGVYIESGSWVWRDEHGRVRRAFGWFGGSYEAAMTFNDCGEDLCSWELRDDRDLMRAVGGYKALDMTRPDHLALIRASVTEAPIAAPAKQVSDG